MTERFPSSSDPHIVAALEMPLYRDQKGYYCFSTDSKAPGFGLVLPKSYEDRLRFNQGREYRDRYTDPCKIIDGSYYLYFDPDGVKEEDKTSFVSLVEPKVEQELFWSADSARRKAYNPAKTIQPAEVATMITKTLKLDKQIVIYAGAGFGGSVGGVWTYDQYADAMDFSHKERPDAVRRNHRFIRDFFTPKTSENSQYCQAAFLNQVRESSASPAHVALQRMYEALHEPLVVTDNLGSLFWRQGISEISTDGIWRGDTVSQLGNVGILLAVGIGRDATGFIEAARWRNPGMRVVANNLDPHCHLGFRSGDRLLVGDSNESLFSIAAEMRERIVR